MFLVILKHFEYQRVGYSLCHPMFVKGKEEIFKKVVLIAKRGQGQTALVEA